MHKQIIKEAWDITQEHKKKLFKYGFFPSLFAVIFGVLYISYQIQAFRHYPIFGGQGGHINIFEIVNDAWKWVMIHKGLTSFLVFFSFIFLLMYFFSPLICEAVLIHYIARIKMGKEPTGGLVVAFDKFFNLLEFSTLLSPLSFFAFVTESCFVMRIYGIGTWVILLPFFTSMLIAGIIVAFLFSFTQNYIVLENENVIGGIKSSTKLVLGNIKDNIFIWLILLVITVRIILNILFILLIPIVFISITQIFSYFSLKGLGLIIGFIVGCILIGTSAYLLAGFTIFVSAVWTIAFIYFRKKEIENSLNIYY